MTETAAAKDSPWWHRLPGVVSNALWFLHGATVSLQAAGSRPHHVCMDSAREFWSSMHVELEREVEEQRRNNNQRKENQL